MAIKDKTYHGHQLIKGVYVTPMNLIPELKLSSWAYERLPDYLWICIVFHLYGRKSGFEIMFAILNYFKGNFKEKIKDISMSSLLNLSDEDQNACFKYLRDILGLGSVFEPLTLFLDLTNCPTFNLCFLGEKTIEEKINIIKEVVKDNYDHNSNAATDVRYCVVIYQILIGKLIINRNQVDCYYEYYKLNHDNAKMRLYRPLIRSTEGATSMGDVELKFKDIFWPRCYELIYCNLLYKKGKKENMELAKDKLDKLHKVVVYLDKLLNIKYQNNNKALVLFGLLSFSYRKFKELVEHDLFLETSGRSIYRTIIESYINSKVLIKRSVSNQSIWDEYIDYGIGQYKKTLEQKEDYEETASHIDYKQVEFLVNDYRNPFFTNIDIRYALGQMRNLCEEVDEKYLYSLYSFDSNVEHCLWGAVEEAALYKCSEATHGFHWSLAVDGENDLPSVLGDTIYVLNKHLRLINKIYELPDDLKEL